MTQPKIDWEKLWQEELNTEKKRRNWDNIASKFGKWIEEDDYPTKLLKYMNITPKDTIVDLGCGEGSITIPLAKKSSKVLAVDKSKEMLNILNKKAKEEKLTNIKTLNEDIFTINKEKIGKYDIVLASRSVSGTYEIKKLIKTLNQISNKYVYITFYGPDNKKEANKALKYIGKETEKIPDHTIIYNLLNSMNIKANVINLECESVKSYDTLKEAIERFKWKMGDITPEQEEKLNKYLKTVFKKNKKGKWENPEDKGDWVLIYWKV